MTVSQVTQGSAFAPTNSDELRQDRLSTTLSRLHTRDRLRVSLPAPSRGGGSRVVLHRRVPRGAGRRAALIGNIHGDRTFFSENWPDRARQWLPTIDHPYDKATGEFIVTAPARTRWSPTACSRRSSTSATGGAARTGSSRCRSPRG